MSGTRILLLAAVLPAILLLIYVYKQDRVEKEPISLIIKLVLGGLVAVFIAIIFEERGLALVDSFTYDSDITRIELENFLGVGLVEEGAKFFVLFVLTWNSQYFDYKFDAIVYAVSVSLGFALFENISYVFSYGMDTAIVRAFTSIPGHASFAVLMGCFYGKAREYYNYDKKVSGIIFVILSLVLPIAAHGAYDFLAEVTEQVGDLMFIIFIFALFTACFFVLKYEARHDHRIYLHSRRNY